MAHSSVGVLAVFTLLLFPSACSTVSTMQSTGSHQTTSAIEAYLRPVADVNDFSGVVRVEKGGKLVTELRFGYADWENQTPHNADTRFGAGSITKSMTASLVLLLEEDGLIARNDRLSVFLPMYTQANEITVAQVLEHTAGLPRDLPPSAREMPDFDLLSWLNEQPLQSQPGEEYSYSNIGYDILAMICEAVSGKSYAKLVDEYLLDPLDLRASSIETHVENAPNAAKGYQPGPLPLDVQSADFPLAMTQGSEGLVASPADLITWARAVLSKQSAHLFEADGSFIGSVRVNEQAGRTVYRLQGTTPGYGSAVLMGPSDDLYIAFGSNLETYSLLGLERVLFEIAISNDTGGARVRKPTTVLEDTHRDLVGTYQHPRFGPVDIEERLNGLYLLVRSTGWKFYLSPTADGELVFRFFNTRIFRDENGTVKAEQSLLGAEPETFDLAPLGDSAW
ncbi:MAG: serine hydrolase domain-containing protein [Pseudomonadota bacterium]